MQEATSPDTVSHQPDREERLSLNHLVTYLPKSAPRVLDCTGAGLIAGRGQMLKDHGASEVVGLLDSSAGESGADANYDEVVRGALDFTALPFSTGHFDCIVCTESLERLRNPETFLKKLLDTLAPGGLFLATVPNMQYHKIVCALTEGRWAYGDSGVWDRKNIRFFTAREVRWLLQNAGMGSIRVASLVRDEESAFPRDTGGYARSGRLRVGPLNDDVYPSWLTEYYLVMAVKPGATD